MSTHSVPAAAARVMRRRALPKIVFAVAAAAMLWAAAPASRAQINAAGSTAATLSLVDAAAGRVEIVRHWPGTAVDVDVYPFVPYFWNGCPAPGAVMFLVTSPSTRRTIPSLTGKPGLGPRLAGAIGAAEDAGNGERTELARLVAGLRTPGDPVSEAAKTLVPAIADLGTYERRGYAVFAFVVWQGWRCAVVFRVVPEGYGIPYVR